MEACPGGTGDKLLSKTSPKSPVQFEEDPVAAATLLSGTIPLPVVP